MPEGVLLVGFLLCKPRADYGDYRGQGVAQVVDGVQDHSCGVRREAHYRFEDDEDDIGGNAHQADLDYLS